jgi:hypothetical protein
MLLSRAAYDARYYAEHREKRRAQQTAYNAAHREELRSKKRVYYAENRDVILAKQATYVEWCQIMTATHPCDVCGRRAELWHHVDPATKRESVSQMYAYSLDNIEAELEKCVPLCSPCHTRLHKAKAAA